MAAEGNPFKTPARNTNRNEFKTPANPIFQTTPLSYSKLTISSFLKKDQSFGGSLSNSSRHFLNASCDRFIPNRSLFDPEMSHFLHTSQKKSHFKTMENKPVPETRVSTPQNNISPPQFEQFAEWKDHYAWSERPARRTEYKARVVALMMNGRTVQPKVLNLSMSLKKPETARIKIPSIPGTPVKRHIPKFPDKILDMPHICKDFGSNIIHWDPGTDMIMVGLDKSVFAWHPVTRFLMKIPVKDNLDIPASYQADSKITAVSFSYNAEYVAVSMKAGNIILWNRQDSILKKLTSECRLGCGDRECYSTSFAWLPPSYHPSSLHCLYVGTKCGHLFNVTILNSAFENHSTEVFQASKAISRISFSTDYSRLAVLTTSGRLTVLEGCTVIVDIDVHLGLAVGLAWCPWQHNYIATASLVDPYLKVWNIKNKSMVLDKHNKVPVTCVTWFEGQRELITGHCSEEADSYLQIWKFPSMEIVCRLVGHQARIIYVAVGLNDSLLASVGADETLLMWRCFDTFKFKNNKWVEVKKIKKEKENLSPTKRLLASSDYLNRLNIR